MGAETQAVPRMGPRVSGRVLRVLPGGRAALGEGLPPRTVAARVMVGRQRKSGRGSRGVAEGVRSLWSRESGRGPSELTPR